MKKPLNLIKGFETIFKANQIKQILFKINYLVILTNENKIYIYNENQN